MLLQSKSIGWFLCHGNFDIFELTGVLSVTHSSTGFLEIGADLYSQTFMMEVFCEKS